MVRNSAGGVRKGLYLVTERADRGGVFSLTYYELLTCQKKRKPKKGIMRPFAIFILLVFFLFNCGDNSTGPEYSQTTDRDALEALYHATNGADWTNDTNWLRDNDLSTWYGVTVSNGRVTHLVLLDNNLTGTIPVELGKLSNLTVLDLSRSEFDGFIGKIHTNQLSGTIPAELGNLSNLKSLHLSWNQLSGPIPSELGNLSKLEQLYLTPNPLSGTIPAELGNLSNLKSLHLSWSQLSGPIPSELGNLSKLEQLYLTRNQLSGPAEQRWRREERPLPGH